MAARATLLLPARERFAGRTLPAELARALGGADRTSGGGEGEAAQLQRHFDLLPRGLPAAALTRRMDAGEDPAAAWLRADPAYVRPDINGARLLAIGEGLALDAEDAEAFLPALRPLFGDAGFPIDAPVPSRWYLRLPPGARPPMFAPPAEALGADLSEHLPEGPEGRRWRALLSEAQVILHNHPRNAARIGAGKPPVNSLWFWGGGRAPDHVACAYARVFGEEALLRALCAAAGIAAEPLPATMPAVEEEAVEGDALFDLRDARDAGALARAWLEPAVAALRGGALQSLRLDFADGHGLALERGHRWRFWRRPFATLDA
jgi:hypothetical protein